MKIVLPLLLLSLWLAGCNASSGSDEASATGAGATAPSAPAPTTPPAASPRPPAGTTLTRYPLVLMHGAGGMTQPDYFHGVPQFLDSLGFTVLETQVSSQLPVTQRADVLRAQILAAFPAPTTRVNLIAHSLGGIDARALIGLPGMADKVVSLTTLGSPHRGTPIVDMILAANTMPFQQTLTNILLGAFGMNLALLGEVNTTAMQTVFNPAHPDDPRVFYQSFAGIADPVGQTGVPVSVNYAGSWPFVFAGGGDNDGLVPVSSAMWGLWRGVELADHGDLAGARPAVFDPFPFYTAIALDLAARGY